MFYFRLPMNHQLLVTRKFPRADNISHAARKGLLSNAPNHFPSQKGAGVQLHSLWLDREGEKKKKSMFVQFSGILQLFFFNLQVALALKMDFLSFLKSV